MNNKKIKYIIVVLIILLAIIAGLCFVCYREFNRLNNPIMAGVELIKMVIFNRDYVLIQENPKTIIAKSNNALNILKEYMNNHGFKYYRAIGIIYYF